MSMPIQRQSEQFSVFDTGTRWERDRPQHELPRGLAGLVNSMGPRITGGMLNTRTAGVEEFLADDDDQEDEDEDYSDLPAGLRELIGPPYEEDLRHSNRTAGWNYPDTSGMLNTRTAGTDSYPTPEHLWEGQGPSHDENGRHLRNSTPSEVEHFRDVARALREHHHIGGWHHPDRRDWTDYDPADDFYDDRPSRADFAEEEAELARKRNYPRGQGPAWNYSEDGDPDPDLESLENTADPERFISGSRRRLAVEEDYSGGDEDDPDWIRENSPRQQEHNRKRGEEIRHSKEMFGSRRPFDRAAGRRLTAFADWKNHIDGDDWMGGYLTFHKARLENGHELHAWRFDNPEAGEGWNWGIVDPDHRPEREYSLPDEFKYLAKAGDDARLDHGGQGNDSLIHGNKIDSFEDAKNEAQTHYEKMFPLGTDTGTHDSGVDYSDLNRFLRDSARRLTAQEPVEPWMDPEKFIKYHNDYFGKESDPTTQDNIRGMSDHELHSYWKDLENARDKTPEQMHQDREQSRAKAKDLADQLWNAFYPPEEEEGRKAVQNIDTVNNLVASGWQPEHIKYDEDDEPYALYQHPSGWNVKDYGGVYKEVGHAATPGEAHDVINVSRYDQDSGQSWNAPFGPQDAHDYIENELHGDPEETGGTFHYLTQNDPRIRRHRPRRARRLAKDGDKASKCTCWEGYERVPGTEPCADGSCRKKTKKKESHRGAGKGIDWSHARPGPWFDAPLYKQDPHDPLNWLPYDGPVCPVCNRFTKLLPKPGCREHHASHTAGFINGLPDGADSASWEQGEQGWTHSSTGCRVQPSTKFSDEWEMVAPTSSKRRPYSIIGHHPDPQVLMDEHDWQTGYGPAPSWHGEPKWWHRVISPPLPPHTAGTEPAEMAPQMPAGGGYQIAHRVGLPWRDQIIPGTVIGLDGPNVAVRWDDGQYSTEEPHNIQLL